MLKRLAEFSRGRILVETGDITDFEGDAIVNAANSGLLGGGGVDGAIHRAAGPELLEACRKIRAEKLPEGLPAGKAVLTGGCRLRAKAVIHTVGPIWRGGTGGEDALLAACYRHAIELAARNGTATLAFPAISTGVYGFPPDRAAPIAVTATAEALARFPTIRQAVFCCFSDASAALHRAALAAWAKDSL